MKKYQVLVLVVFNFAIGLAIVWFTFDETGTLSGMSDTAVLDKYTTNRSSGRDTDRRTSAEITILKDELVSLRVQLDELRKKRQSKQPDSDKSVPTETVGQAVTSIPQDGAEQPVITRISQQEQAVAQADLLEQQIQLEAPDSSWSNWAEDEIMAKINDRDYTGMNVIGAECRTSMCRLELQFDDTLKRDETLADVPSLVPWDSQGFFHADENDPLNMVIYISREGEQLTSLK